MTRPSSTLTEPWACVQWMWQSNANPLDKSQPAEWIRFSDVENLIIEEAFQAKQLHVILDNYCIDFKHNTQVSKTDTSKQSPIKRMIGKRDCIYLRQERFLNDPVSCKHSFGGQYGWISPFIKEIRKDLKLEKNQLPSRDASIVPVIVEKAALGIIEEGRKVGRLSIAKWMAKELKNQKDKGVKEVWKCCAHLYSMEDFLYKKLNETMRLVGSNEHEDVWRKSAVHEALINRNKMSIDNDSYREAYYAARRTSIAAASIDTGYLDRDIYVRDYNIDE
ncbi:unnamed protein product [Rotaria sp. Silwood2]|nr:unnamed protein product [Rotaria sp. Silwood2]